MQLINAVFKTFSDYMLIFKIQQNFWSTRPFKKQTKGG